MQNSWKCQTSTATPAEPGGLLWWLVAGYHTRKHGLDYKEAWNHPLSPYYEKDEAWLPIHPQPGGLGHRHWLAWVMGQGSERKRQRRARVVEHFMTHRGRAAPGALRLWAFGCGLLLVRRIG